jgi:hypothetical protein
MRAILVGFLTLWASAAWAQDSNQAPAVGGEASEPAAASQEQGEPQAGLVGDAAVCAFLLEEVRELQCSALNASHRAPAAESKAEESEEPEEPE